MKSLDPSLLAALALASTLAVGCSSENPRPSEDPTYEGSDVQAEEIKQVFPPFGGQTVVVVPYVNKSLSRYQQLGNTAPDIISSFLIDAGFRVLEGKGGQLGEVLDELQYGQSEFVDPKTAAKIGKQFGARYVWVGAVTDYNEVRSRGGREFSALGIVEVGGKSEALVYNVAVASRLVDVETREILGADSGTRKKQRFEVEGGKVKIVGIGTEKKQSLEDTNETMGAVLRLAFATSTNRVITQLNRRAAYPAAPAAASAPPPAPPPPAQPPERHDD